MAGFAIQPKKPCKFTPMALPAAAKTEYQGTPRPPSQRPGAVKCRLRSQPHVAGTAAATPPLIMDRMERGLQGDWLLGGSADSSRQNRLCSASSKHNKLFILKQSLGSKTKKSH